MKIGILLVLVVLWAEAAYAAHPLITDDTGTQGGKGKVSFELNGEVSLDEEEIASEFAVIASYGITEKADIVVGVPYQWIKVEEESVEGISDISMELKWRFYEKDGLSFAFKPAIALPTGDESKGLGNGKAAYGIVLIMTKTLDAWEFHFNLGYTHNEYMLTADENANRKDIWHLSLAPTVEVLDDLKAVANIGIERNPDKSSDTYPAFILGGLIYSISERLDIDGGIKTGLNEPEADITSLVGMAVRF